VKCDEYIWPGQQNCQIPTQTLKTTIKFKIKLKMNENKKGGNEKEINTKV
jgi:hypothetical protein